MRINATAFEQLATSTLSGSMPFSVMVGGLVEEGVDHDKVVWRPGAAPLHACH